MSATQYRLRVNETTYEVSAEPRKLLADVLREECGLTGTHLGCEHGVCGACTVLIDGEPIRSCLVFGIQCEGRSIRTVEGLAHEGQLHPLQRAFSEEHALQCGFCTPGFLMLAVALLESNPQADGATVREVLASNLCRCTGYQNIVTAVQRALTESTP